MKTPALDSRPSTAVALEPIIISGQKRRSQPLPARDRVVEATAAAMLAIAVAGIAAGFGSDRGFDLWPALLLTAGYAIAARVRFVAGAGYADPSELVFVPMLLLLPLPVVPVLVAAGLILSRLPDLVTRRLPADHVVSLVAGAWFSVAPVVVVAALAGGESKWSLAPAYLAALGAQLVSDWLVSSLREWLAAGVPPSLQLAVVLRVWMVDVLLWPVGLVAALSANGHPGRALAVLPLVGLLAVFAEERNTHVAHVLELSRAYRGTALLLGDVLEDKDSYTASHSHGVVDMSLRVADALGLDASARRRVEFGALLHDIGKIAVPGEIINKPGPLDDKEWAVMRLHTVEGQEMLDRVGGVLGDVGRIVRASHEYFNGAGYPDGLAGERIPIEARIISCCDALSAMTTDRSYRAAMSFEAAVDELRAHAGSQFDPKVVETLLALVESDDGRRMALGRRPSRAAVADAPS